MNGPLHHRLPWFTEGQANPAFESTEVIRQGGRARATLTLVAFEGRLAVLKNFAHESALFRRSWGRFMARREARAHCCLAQVVGIPRLLGRLSPDGLLLEYVSDATPARDAGRRLSQDFFERLILLLGRVRASGVLHGDIGRNVLATRDGSPVLVDFGSSLVIPRLPPRLRAALLACAALHDERAIVKLKARSAPNLMTDQDQLVLAHRLPFERPLELLEEMVHLVVRLRTGSTAPHR